MVLERLSMPTEIYIRVSGFKTKEVAMESLRFREAASHSKASG